MHRDNNYVFFETLIDSLYLKILLLFLHKLCLIITKFIGTVQMDHILYTNFTGFPAKSDALDNNVHTFYQSDPQDDLLWFLRLNSTYDMKWFLVSIRGGLIFN